MSLLPSVGVPVVATLNHLLSRQPALAARLATHAGKLAAIDAGLLRLSLRIGADGLLQDAATATADQATAATEAAAATAIPNVTIRINPADLPQVLADMRRAFAYVHISGDAEFAKAISEVANGLHWEAEEDLAPFVGDIAAVRIARAGREAVDTLKTGSRRLLENITEYLHEENPTLLYRAAGEDFAAAVSVLRDDVERLAKRIALLEKQAGGQS